MKRVSKHAHKRGLERGGISNKKIKEVMVYGYPPVCFEGPFYDFLQSVKYARGGAITVKVKDSIVVIYNRRSQRAITVYKVPDKYEPWDSYLIPVFKKARKDGEATWMTVSKE